MSSQLAGEYEAALNLYEQFLASKPEDDEFNRGAYLINVAICQANLDRPEEALENLRKAFNNKAAFRVKDVSLLQGLLELVSSFARAAPDNPALLDTAHRALDEFIPMIKIGAYDMQRYNPLVVKTAQEIGAARQFGLALRVYTLYAGVQDAIDELLARSISVRGHQ